MAKSSKQVLGFLDDLARRCRPAAPREFSDLEEFAGRKLEAWDLAYFSERLQESRFKVSQEALRPYFPLPKVLSGLFAVTERLYGISVRERPGVSVWHPSVRYYDLTDSQRADRRGLLSRSLFARREAQRSVDGRVRRRQIAALGQDASRWRSWYAISPRRSAPRPRS